MSDELAIHRSVLLLFAGALKGVATLTLREREEANAILDSNALLYSAISGITIDADMMRRSRVYFSIATV